MVSKGTAVGAIVFIIGLLIFLDDLHDFVPGTGMFHWLPDFTPIFIFGFHLEHLYIGALLMLFGLLYAIKYKE